MKRILGIVAVATGIVATIAAVGMTIPAQAAVNDFRIVDYRIQYELSRDSESRSIVKTTETITAEFPGFDQNHGLERALPTDYDGHPVSLNIESVTNGDGTKLDYSAENSNGVKVLRIGDPDSYVYGQQTYKIIYTQRDVTRFFADTGRDEWYWDTNGTDWKVPIDSLAISVAIDPTLMATYDNTQACYQGHSGESKNCTIESGPNSGEYTVVTSGLSPEENVTLAFGFTAGTFAGYSRSLPETLFYYWQIILVLSIPIAIVMIIIFSILYWRRAYRQSELYAIPAQYIPPNDASVVVSAQVVGVATTVFSAQLIDLAVRRFISIIETRPKSTWRTAEYDIVIEKDLQPLRAEEKEILSDMFGHEPKQGERLELASLKNNMTYSARTLDNDRKLKTLIESDYALREHSPQASRFFYRWATATVIVAIVTLSIPLAVAAGTIWLFGKTIRPLSDIGLALRRYVLGLSKYIKASEAERLAYLQGPDTAQKVGYQVDPTKPGDLIKLYERTLPYAILFGQEKQWAGRLGAFYERAGENPGWYTGTTAFNAVIFANSVQSFSQASVYSAGSSSSSGGSGGGGSSGGGGGGGGGGGW